jgi:hypothetical protein
MRAKYLALALALVVAAPTLATAAVKHHKAAAKADSVEPDHNGPVPYADLAAIDAKLNAPATVHHAKRHMAHKKAAASTAASAAAPASAPAK